MARDKNIAIGGQAYALNVLTPIRGGLEAELRELLAAIPAGRQSPFAKLPGTHFARLVIVDGLAFEGARGRKPELRLQYLLFSSVFDGPRDDYLRELCARIPDEAEAIWGRCLGAPTPVAADDDAFAAWIGHNQVQTGAFFAPYGDATVRRIVESLDLCRRLREFAQRTQYLSPPQLKARYDADFNVREVGA
ncbi:MAG TPA: hypothetical protein VGO80_00570 [Solirubrobacteraceae bacterium]|jgi:hypothetical protein|nr:hypothetical protein [Solirubrobacteraceae bacterium]